MSSVTYIHARTGGFTRMDNDLYEALIGAELSARELRVAMAIHRLTAGYNKGAVKVAALYIAKMMYGEEGADSERANVSRAINSLIRQRVLFRDGGSRDPITFMPAREWRIDAKHSVLKSTHCVGNASATVLQTTHIKDTKDIKETTSLVDAERQPEQMAAVVEPEQPVRQKSSMPPCPHQAIVDLFHETLPELPAIAILNDGRKRALQTRWRENAVHRDLEFWRDYFGMVKASAFLVGNAPARNGGKPFRATFDWLIAPSNFVKVVEGNYHA